MCFFYEKQYILLVAFVMEKFNSSAQVSAAAVYTSSITSIKAFVQYYRYVPFSPMRECVSYHEHPTLLRREENLCRWIQE